MSSDSFLYFAYGSNLMKERMQLDNNCHFTFKCTAKLENYELKFGSIISKIWGGSYADIRQKEGCSVWGVVWQTDVDGVEQLDKQEDILKGVYGATDVTVQTAVSEQLVCRSYKIVDKSDCSLLPSKYYMAVILKGAVQHKLPDEYIQQLKALPVSDFVGEVENYRRLGFK